MVSKEITPDFTYEVGRGDTPIRLDMFLAQKMGKFSRSQIQKWIRKGHVLLDGKPTDPSEKVAPGQDVRVYIPAEELSLVAEKIPLDILFEDSEILVVNKASGMVTHPARGNYTGTLANAVAHHLERGLTPKGSDPIPLRNPRPQLRPGIVHRLDKDTSGVLVIAKNRKTLDFLSKQFEKRTVEKVYRAVVQGVVTSKKGEIVGSIGKDYDRLCMAVTSGGRYARTDFKVLKKFPGHTYLEVYPKTGRTHQIRVHLAKIGHPVLGDHIYSDIKVEAPRLMLHAYSLSFQHPTTKKKVSFKASLPADFRRSLDGLS